MRKPSVSPVARNGHIDSVLALEAGALAFEGRPLDFDLDLGLDSDQADIDFGAAIFFSRINPSKQIVYLLKFQSGLSMALRDLDIAIDFDDAASRS